MIVAIHQPDYLPHLPFFEKMRACDIFVLLDDAQYTRNSFINRNRINTPNGSLWLTVPVLNNGRFGQLIKDVEIDNSQDWARKHWKTIKQNYPKAGDFLEHTYSQRWDKLIDLNCELIAYIALQLGIIGRLCVFASSLGITTQSTQRLIDICKNLNADTYLSGAGGRKYQEESAFSNAGIKLLYQDHASSGFSAIHDLLASKGVQG